MKLKRACLMSHSISKQRHLVAHNPCELQWCCDWQHDEAYECSVWCASLNDKKTFVDPLKEWWVKQAKTYPNLSRLVRKYFGLPASAATSERAFTVAGSIISPKRAMLDPTNVENLHFLRENWDKVFWRWPSSTMTLSIFLLYLVYDNCQINLIMLSPNLWRQPWIIGYMLLF